MTQSLLPTPDPILIGAVARNTSQISATATTTNVTVISYTIAPGTTGLGATYRVFVSGTGDNTATSPTFIFDLLIGSTVLATVTIPSITTAATDKAWFVIAYITFRVIGSTGKVVGSLQVVNEMASAVTGNILGDSPVVNAATFNTDTLSQTIALAMRQGTAVAGNVTRAEVAVIERVSV